QKDLSGFNGNKDFTGNAYSQNTFAKLRGSIGGMYAWRAQHAPTSTERARMAKEADVAFRQAFALAPQSPEAVFRYVNLLMTSGRNDDAEALVTASLAVDKRNAQLSGLLAQLRRMKK